VCRTFITAVQQWGSLTSSTASHRRTRWTTYTHHHTHSAVEQFTLLNFNLSDNSLLSRKFSSKTPNLGPKMYHIWGCRIKGQIVSTLNLLCCKFVCWKIASFCSPQLLNIKNLPVYTKSHIQNSRNHFTRTLQCRMMVEWWTGCPYKPMWCDNLFVTLIPCEWKTSSFHRKQQQTTKCRKQAQSYTLIN